MIGKFKYNTCCYVYKPLFLSIDGMKEIFIYYIKLKVILTANKQ